MRVGVDVNEKKWWRMEIRERRRWGTNLHQLPCLRLERPLTFSQHRHPIATPFYPLAEVTHKFSPCKELLKRTVIVRNPKIPAPHRQVNTLPSKIHQPYHCRCNGEGYDSSTQLQSCSDQNQKKTHNRSLREQKIKQMQKNTKRHPHPAKTTSSPNMQSQVPFRIRNDNHRKRDWSNIAIEPP